MVCSTEEEWEGLVEALEEVRHPEARRLYRALSEELWPEVQRELTVKERQFKRKLLAELPRRTSDRIALKAQQKAEQVREQTPCYLVGIN